jgi:hypothetical protein
MGTMISESVLRKAVRYRGSVRTSPAITVFFCSIAAPDYRDIFRAHIVNSDPAIFTEFANHLGKAFSSPHAIATARRRGANLVQRVVHHNRHGDFYPC